MKGLASNKSHTPDASPTSISNDSMPADARNLCTTFCSHEIRWSIIIEHRCTMLLETVASGQCLHQILVTVTLPLQSTSMVLKRSAAYLCFASSATVAAIADIPLRKLCPVASCQG